jgi:hypothetical protein
MLYNKCWNFHGLNKNSDKDSRDKGWEMGYVLMRCQCWYPIEWAFPFAFHGTIPECVVTYNNMSPVFVYSSRAW